nr:geranylgeranyl reductase family protein [Motilibacter deserti]
MGLVTLAWDVVIVGAGPAGSSAALSALRCLPGARVLLLDREKFPRDKVCGDAVGPRSFHALSALGLESEFTDYQPASRMVLGSRSSHAEHPQRGEFRVVPRRVFDARLVRAAVQAGAVLERRRVRTIESTDEAVMVDGELVAHVVIGADGAESVLRGAMTVTRPRATATAVAIRGYGPTSAPTPRIISQSRDWPAYAWEFPIGDGTSNFGYIDVPRRDRTITKDTLLAGVRELLPGAAERVETWKGHRLPLATARPTLPDGRLLLVGDAACLVNPSSGEGILDALVSGTIAGECAHLGPDAGAAYRRRLREVIGRHQRDAWVGAQLCRVPVLASLGLQMAKVDRRFFDATLELTLGDGHIKPLVTGRALARLGAVRARERLNISRKLT